MHILDLFLVLYILDGVDGLRSIADTADWDTVFVDFKALDFIHFKAGFEAIRTTDFAPVFTHLDLVLARPVTRVAEALGLVLSGLAGDETFSLDLSVEQVPVII